MFRAPSLWSPINQFLAVEQYGSPRFLESPLVPLPCSWDPGRASFALPSQQRGVAPADTTTKAATISTISGLIHTASVLAVYASSFGFPYTGKTRFRWVASPFRVGFEPTGLYWRISRAAPLRRLSQRPRLRLAPRVSAVNRVVRKSIPVAAQDVVYTGVKCIAPMLIFGCPLSPSSLMKRGPLTTDRRTRGLAARSGLQPRTSSLA